MCPVFLLTPLVLHVTAHCPFGKGKEKERGFQAKNRKQISHAKGVAIQHEQIGQLESEDKAGGNMQQDRFPMIVCQL